MRSKSAVIHVFPFNSEKKRGAVAVQVVRKLCISDLNVKNVPMSLNEMAHSFSCVVRGKKNSDGWDLRRSIFVTLFAVDSLLIHLDMFSVVDPSSRHFAMSIPVDSLACCRWVGKT